MKKHNFILTKHNYKMFVASYNQLLNKTGCIRSWVTYPGRKKFDKLYGMICKHFNTYNVHKSNDSYNLASKIQCPWELRSNGIGCNPDKASGIYIPFGTKMLITSNSITWNEIETLSFLDEGWSKIYHNVSSKEIEFATISIENSEAYSQEYYDMYEKEMMRDFEKEKQFY